MRAARVFFGWTQREAYEKWGIAHSTIIDVERGARQANSITRGKVGIALLKLGIRFEGVNMILPPEPPAR